MNNGWIKVYRKIQEKGYYKKSQYIHLWIHLLLKANHKQKEFMWNKEIIIIKEGQLLTGRKELSKETGIGEGTIENILKILESEQQILQQKTTKFRIITIINYKTYQENKNEIVNDIDNKNDNKVTTELQQNDTNKNNKNIKNEKKRTSEFDFSFLDDRFKDIFMRWLQYKKDKRQKYANQDSLESCYNKLIKYSSNDPETAKEIIEDAMAKSYSGFFELKNNNNGKRTRESNSKQQFESVKI